MRRCVRTPSSSSAHTLAFALGLVLATTTLSCRSVEPWERAAFSARRMQSDPHVPHQDLLDHVQQSREAMATGRAPSGAGCGCY